MASSMEELEISKQVTHLADSMMFQLPLVRPPLTPLAAQMPGAPRLFFSE